MFEYTMEHICSYNVELDPEMEVIGPTPEGLRVNVYIVGGEVVGAKLQGKVKPVGADWLIVREDGVGVLNVRATLETQDEALIYLDYQGVMEIGEDGYKRFMEGDLPPVMPIRAAPRFITAHPSYTWLNRLQCVNIGEARVSPGKVGVFYDVYALK